MLQNAINNDSIVNNPLLQQQEVQGAGKNKSLVNPYTQSSEFIDESSISDTALKLYEYEKDVQKYKGLVLDSLDTDDGTKEIASLLESGQLEISDDDLAQSMLDDEDFINSLF